MPPGPCQVTEQAKFTHSTLGRELKKETKLIKGQKRNYVDVGLDAISHDQTILNIENKMKELGNFD